MSVPPVVNRLLGRFDHRCDLSDTSAALDQVNYTTTQLGGITELLNRKRWNTRVELASAMFEYVDVFHNRHRRHSSIGMLTPITYENMHHAKSA